jgi:hypothetical protein
MNYARTERFKKAYAKLPPEIQAKVSKAFQLFKENPRHPSLGSNACKDCPISGKAALTSTTASPFTTKKTDASFATLARTRWSNVSPS